MSSVIRDLLVKVGIDSDEKQAVDFDDAIAGLKKTMLAAAAAAGTMGASLFEITRRTANAGDEAAKMAKEIGTTAESMQELEFAAEITGTSVSEMSTGLRRLGRSARDAEQGTDRAQEAFQQLGVETTDTQGEFRDNLDIFEDTLGALTEMDSSVRRAALAQDVLGRSGTKLLRIAERGGMSISELRDQARDLGFVMSDEAAAQSEEFNDSLTRMRFFLRGLRNQIGLEFMPAMTDAINGFREWLQANRDFIEAGIDRGLGAIADGFDAVLAAAEEVDRIVQRYTDWHTVITTIASAVAALGAIKFAPAIIAGVKGIIAVVGALLGPLGLKIAAFVALVLAIQDLVVWFQGGESVIGEFIESIETGEGQLGSFIEFIQELVGIAQSAVIPIFERARQAGERFGEFVALAIEELRPAFGSAMDAVQAFASVYTSVVELHWRVMARAVKIIAGIVLTLFDTVLIPIWESLLPVVNFVLDTVLSYFELVFESIEEALDFFIAVFEGEFDSIGEAADEATDIIWRQFERVFDFILGQIERVTDLFGAIADNIPFIGDDGGIVGDAAGAVGDFFGGGAAEDQATAQRQQEIRNRSMVANSGDTEINVETQADDPQGVADEVERRQRRVNEADRRQANQSFRGGDI